MSYRVEVWTKKKEHIVSDIDEALELYDTESNEFQGENRVIIVDDEGDIIRGSYNKPDNNAYIVEVWYKFTEEIDRFTTVGYNNAVQLYNEELNTDHGKSRVIIMDGDLNTIKDSYTEED